MFLTSLFALCMGAGKMKKSFWVGIKALPSGCGHHPTGCPCSDLWEGEPFLRGSCIALNTVLFCSFLKDVAYTHFVVKQER